MLHVLKKKTNIFLHGIKWRWKSLEGLEAWEVGLSLWLCRLKSLYLWTSCVGGIGRLVPAVLWINTEVVVMVFFLCHCAELEQSEIKAILSSMFCLVFSIYENTYVKPQKFQLRNITVYHSAGQIMLGTQFRLKVNTSVIYQLSERWGCKKRETLSFFKSLSSYLIKIKLLTEKNTIVLSSIVPDVSLWKHT